MKTSKVNNCENHGKAQHPRRPHCKKISKAIQIQQQIPIKNKKADEAARDTIPRTKDDCV